jgi:uncharacterized protein (TIGR00369 family)
MNARELTVSWDDPQAGAEQGRLLSGIEYLRAMIDGRLPQPPVARLMHFRLAEVEHGRAVFTITPAEYHYNPIGSVHGGVACTLLDSCMACSVHSTLPAGTGYTSLEVKINFVRAVTANTGPLRAEGKLIHAGSRIATAEGRLVDAAGKVYSHGTTTCLIFPHLRG